MNPGRRRPLFLYTFALILIAAGLYLSYELGRDRAGYSLFDERRQTEIYEAEIAHLEQAVEDLRRQQTILETSREIDRETYARVESNLNQLQARIQAQDEELVFYRGIVSPQDGLAGLRIQSLEVLTADSEQNHVLKLMLVQAIVQTKRVSGVVRVTLAGSLDNVHAEFDLEELVADDAAEEMSYEFRYFQSFEQELSLPAGFQPDTVEVEIWPTEPRGDPVTQSFQWSAVRG
jgi:hypothetical protein